MTVASALHGVASRSTSSRSQTFILPRGTLESHRVVDTRLRNSVAPLGISLQSAAFGDTMDQITIRQVSRAAGMNETALKHGFILQENTGAARGANLGGVAARRGFDLPLCAAGSERHTAIRGLPRDCEDMARRSSAD